MTAHARLAALLILAQRNLDRDKATHPLVGYRDPVARERRVRLEARADALADAYALTVADDLGLHALLTRRRALLEHAAQQCARQAVAL